MCGIVGLKTVGKNVSLIKNMKDAVKHRGPDGNDIFLDGNVALGHTRLAILDLSKAGSQPMTSFDGNETIVFNGEIYNYLEIKRELKSKGYKFISDTDTEVILNSYKEWGFECLKKFNGMFAFCIYDKKRQILFLARDRIGIKPLYFYSDKDIFAFASEIKALLKLGLKRLPNDKIIYEYLAKGIYDHSSETFFQNIFQLEAGNYMIVDSKQKIKKYKYWNIAKESKKYRNVDFKTKLSELLKNSTSIQLRSDVPVGLNLSGGIDSATLAVFVTQSINNTRLKTFTMGFSDSDDERKEVKEVLKYLKCENKLVISSPEELKDLLDDALFFQDQPFGGLQTIAYMNLAKAAKKEGFSVVLEGQGGDELFAGYRSYLLGYLKDCVRENKTEKVKNLMKTLGISNSAEIPKNFNYHTDLTKNVWADVLSDSFVNKFKNTKVSFDCPFDSELLNMQYHDIKYLKIPRVLRFNDHMTMSTAVELRVPILDHRIVELAMAMPAELKIHNGLGKYILRELTEGILPESIRFRPKKSVVTPQTKWLQTIFKKFVEDIINSDSFNKRKYFNSEKVKKRFKEFCSEENPENSFPIWQWIMIELWLRKFIDPQK